MLISKSASAVRSPLTRVRLAPPAAVFRRVNKLPDFRPLLIQFGQMLRPHLLIHLEFLLGVLFVAHPDVGLPQPVINIRQIAG